jgi:hypothetical protein
VTFIGAAVDIENSPKKSSGALRRRGYAPCAAGPEMLARAATRLTGAGPDATACQPTALLARAGRRVSGPSRKPRSL